MQNVHTEAINLIVLKCALSLVNVDKAFIYSRVYEYKRFILANDCLVHLLRETEIEYFFQFVKIILN